MNRPAQVLDTGALPVVCLLEVYRILDHDEHELVGPLRANPTVLTLAVDAEPGLDSTMMIGAMARRTGRLGASHAVYTAMASSAEVVTSRPDQIRAVLGETWPVLEV